MSKNGFPLTRPKSTRRLVLEDVGTVLSMVVGFWVVLHLFELFV